MGDEGLQGSMQLEIDYRGPAAVMSIRGSAGMEEADAVRQGIEGLVERKVPVIVLDLSDLEFISSLGLGALIAGHIKSRHHHGVVRIVNPRPSVMQLLEVTRLTKIFDIYDSVDRAVEA